MTEAARGVALAIFVALVSACGGTTQPRPVVVEPAAIVPLVDSHAYEEFLRAELLAELGYWDEAADALRAAIHAEPQAPTLHLRLARAAAHVAGATAEGLMACDLAAQLDAAPADVALARAALHESAGDLEAAIAVFRDVPAPDSSPALFQEWIGVAATTNEPDSIREAAEAFTRAFPEAPAAWRALGEATRDADPATAADAFGHATTLPDPEPSDAYRRIELLVEADDWDAALVTASDCRDRFWEYWPCTAWQAVILDRGRAEADAIDEPTREALEHLAFMVSLDSRQLAQSGYELLASGSPSLATAYARIVADTRPHNANVITTAVWFANNAGDFDLAVELMERVLVLDDSNFDALNYIGYTWAERGENLEQAEVYIREALFLRGDDGNILDSLAWVYFRMERYEEALEVQLRAIELVDANAVIWDHLGDIYAALGRMDEAIDAWERALSYAGDGDEDVVEDAPRKIREAQGQS